MSNQLPYKSLLEKVPTHEMVLRNAMDSLQASLYTAMPCIIESFDPDTCTCTCQPSIRGRKQTSQGWESVTLPLLVDVPVVFPNGGGCVFTFPIKKGDECLVIFASRCIDNWWQSGGIQEMGDMRMHNLSDGIAIVGMFSKPNVPSNISTSAAQFRSVSGDTVVEIDPEGEIISMKSPNTIEIDAPGLHVNGWIKSDQEVTAGMINLTSHKHIGVTVGTGITGIPTP